MKTWKHRTLIAIAVIFGMAVAFTACTDEPDNKDNTDKVQREFPITGTFYRAESQTSDGEITYAPYTATITIVDQTNGSVSLAEQGMMTKLDQVFAELAGMTQTGGVTEQSAYTVFPRGIKINIVNSGESFDGFQALNSNTARCHIDFLASANATFIAAHFSNALYVLAGIVHAQATPAHAPAQYLTMHIETKEKEA